RSVITKRVDDKGRFLTVDRNRTKAAVMANLRIFEQVVVVIDACIPDRSGIKCFSELRVRSTRYLGSYCLSESVSVYVRIATNKCPNGRTPQSCGKSTDIR